MKIRHYLFGWIGESKQDPNGFIDIEPPTSLKEYEDPKDLLRAVAEALGGRLKCQRYNTADGSEKGFQFSIQIPDPEPKDDAREKWIEEMPHFLVEYRHQAIKDWFRRMPRD